MSAIEITPFEQTEIDVLLDFQRKVYADDPNWVPPLDAWVKKRLDPDSGFFKEAELTLLAARRDSEVVGTISVLRDKKRERLKGEKIGYFGFFETIDDPEVSAALLAEAERRARGFGAEMLRGPRNLSRVEEVGTLVEGFDKPPPMLAAHQPAYYAEHIEAAGYAPHHDTLAYDISLREPDGSFKQLPEKLERKAAEVDIPGLVTRPLRWRTVRKDLIAAHEVFVEGFRDVPDNTPMPRGQFVSIAGVGIVLSKRDMLQLGFVDGKPAGFALCFPELNEAIRAADGKLLWKGFPGILGALPKVKTASFKLLGVLPEYRKHGLHAFMIREAIAAIQSAGYERLEASLVDGRNVKMRKIVEESGMEIYKRYRTYEKKLA